MRHALTAIATCLLVAHAATAQSTRPASSVVAPRPMPELKLEGVGLSDALDYFRDLTGVNMVVDWPALEAVGVAKDTPVTVRLRKPVFKTALRKTLDSAAPNGLLAFYVDGNILHITTQAVADARMVTRVYLVGDLLLDVPDYQGPELSLQSSNSGNRSGGGGGGSGGSSVFSGMNTPNAPTRPAGSRADQLIDVIRTTIRPDVWDVNGGKATIRLLAGKLVVTAPVSVQEAIGGR